MVDEKTGIRRLLDGIPPSLLPACLLLDGIPPSLLPACLMLLAGRSYLSTQGDLASGGETRY